MKNIIKLFSIIIFFCVSSVSVISAEKVEYLKTDWTFKGLFGKFDRASLQRGYQVYTEVCAACHSMKYLSYRNLSDNFAGLVNISPSAFGPSITSKDAAIAFAWASVNSGPPFSARFL